MNEPQRDIDGRDEAHGSPAGMAAACDREDGASVGVQQPIWREAPVEPHTRGDAHDVQRRRAKRAQGRIVEIPPIGNPARRAKCAHSLRLFLTTYLAPIFAKPFARYHREIIAAVEYVIRSGGQQALAAPRGGGKSAITIGAALWAILYGYRRFLVPIGATASDSNARLETIRQLVERNDLLYEDFPGLCACVRALEGNIQRQRGQRIIHPKTGFPHPTGLQWSEMKPIVFPDIPGEPYAGAIIACRSMDGAIRGLVHSRAGGLQRPDFVFLDDPQTTEQAMSEGQVDKLEKRIRSDVLLLAGPGETLAGIFLGTCIVRGDLTDRFLDQSRWPSWRGTKFRLMDAMPANMALWTEDYDSHREESLREHGDLRLATDFYVAHRAAMDAGALPTWDSRFMADAGEISATQHAMNKYLELGQDAFMAELQNEPPEPQAALALNASAETVRARTAPTPRGVPPDDTLAIVRGIDVGKRWLHWVVLAVSAQRRCCVLDYGAQTVHAPYASGAPDDPQDLANVERAITDALRALDAHQTERPLHVMATAVDARYMDRVIRRWAAEASADPGHGLVMPVMGHGSIKGQVMYRPPKEASVSRDGYLYARDEGGGVVYHSHADAYKQIIHTGFLLDRAEPGSMCLFRPTRHNEHAGYARHIASEQQIEAGTGAYKWERTRGGGENHWLDATCLAQAAITYLEHRMPALAINLARPTSDAPAPQPAPAPARPAPAPPASSPPTRPRGFERPEPRNNRWRGIRSRR